MQPLHRNRNTSPSLKYCVEAPQKSPQEASRRCRAVAPGPQDWERVKAMAKGQYLWHARVQRQEVSIPGYKNQQNTQGHFRRALLQTLKFRNPVGSLTVHHRTLYVVLPGLAEIYTSVNTKGQIESQTLGNKPTGNQGQSLELGKREKKHF